jgi:hypothetical protein
MRGFENTVLGRIAALQRVEVIGDLRKVPILELQNFILYYEDRKIEVSDNNRTCSIHWLHESALEILSRNRKVRKRFEHFGDMDTNGSIMYTISVHVHTVTKPVSTKLHEVKCIDKEERCSSWRDSPGENVTSAAMRMGSSPNQFFRQPDPCGRHWDHDNSNIIARYGIKPN